MCLLCGHNFGNNNKYGSCYKHKNVPLSSMYVLVGCLVNFCECQVKHDLNLTIPQTKFDFLSWTLLACTWWGMSLQPWGHESATLTTRPPSTPQTQAMHKYAGETTSFGKECDKIAGWGRLVITTRKIWISWRDRKRKFLMWISDYCKSRNFRCLNIFGV